jgi:hydroxymethylglutaryl-CoA reductase
MIGQMQLLGVPDVDAAGARLLEHKNELIAAVNEVDPVLNRLGGGARDLEVRVLRDTPLGPFIVVHLIYDVRDAMANAVIRPASSYLNRSPMRGRIHLRILSNLRIAAASLSWIPLNWLSTTTAGSYDGIIETWACSLRSISGCG